MATLYARKGRWWLAWFEGGERFYSSTGLQLHQEAEARAMKEELERKVSARASMGLPLEVTRTVGGYKRAWIKKRREDGIASVDDDEARLVHAKELDALLLRDVRVPHVRDLIRRLVREKTLAPRTIRHVFFLLRQMFRDARSEEKMERDPCELPRGILPGKQDKDPTWRATAVYAREEIEALISDPRIPEDRRVLYALLFLVGARIGEIADRRWRDYDAPREPLGCLHINTSFHTKTRKSKGTKTNVVRQAPVHRVLAKALAAWRLGGWARMIGRPPTVEDYIIPTALNRPRTSNHARNKLLADLERVGLRPRRTHDTRRTFISLAIADGAREDILKWVTHGPPKSIMGLYTTLPWAALCAEVAKLNIRLDETATPQLHRNRGI